MKSLLTVHLVWPPLLQIMKKSANLAWFQQVIFIFSNRKGVAGVKVIFGEGVAGVINNKDVADSPFRLTTTTSNHEEVCKFSLLSTGKGDFF